MFNVVKNTKNFAYTDVQRPRTWTNSEHWIGQRWGEGEGRMVLCDERTAVGESYLPLGRSPSSFLQRTVGTGSPRASHLNSTLWSTNTTRLSGRCTKLGRSTSIKTNKCIFKNHRSQMVIVYCYLKFSFSPPNHANFFLLIPLDLCLRANCVCVIKSK